MELRKREGAESAKKPLDAKARRKRKDEREPETDDGKARNSRALLRISRSNLSDFAASLPSRFRVKENFALSPTFAFSQFLRWPFLGRAPSDAAGAPADAVFDDAAD